MNKKRIIDFFNYIEKNYFVNQWRINGVDVWPYLRLMLGNKLVSVSRPTSTYKPEVNNKGSLSNLSLLLTENNKVDVFVLFDSITRIKLNDCWYNRLSGPFNSKIKKMGLNVVNLEFSAHNIERFPVCDESFSISNQLAFIQKNIHIRQLPLLEMYEKVKKEFLQQFGENFDFPTLESLNKDTWFIQKLSDIFEIMFILKETKIALMVNYYQQISYAFTLAARRVGIPSVDIQHGNQRDIYYHRWSNTPENGYNILPNYFWCWNSDDASSINDWAVHTNAHKAINGGNPWIEFWKDINSPVVSEYNKRLEKEFGEKVNLLITLQPLYGFLEWRENIPPWVIEAIDKSPENWKWHIRYHPQMLGKYRNEMENCEKKLAYFIDKGKVETKKATYEPLMAMLRGMTVHITAFSTSVIEAMHLQVPSITIHDQALEFFKSEFESGWVIQAKNTNELLNSIQTLIAKKKKGQLPPMKSNSIGLTKGLEIILDSNNKEFNYQSKLNLSPIQKEIYFSDGCYQLITNEYEKQPSDVESFISGKAYGELGNIQKAKDCYDNYLNFLSNFPNKSNVDMNTLIELVKFYRHYNMFDKVEIVENIIEKLIEKYENQKLSLFMNLFQNNEYIDIIKWREKTTENLDVNYFSGRSFLKLGDIDLGIKILTDYLTLYSKQEFNIRGLTLQQNYRVSAHFYLGEAYLTLNDRESAKYHFEQCSFLLNGQHIRANEYLKRLS